MTALCRRCGREYAEVRVGEMVLYGHLRPPSPPHAVRLARSADESGLAASRSRSGREDTRRPSGVPGASVTSSRTSNGTRAARNGRDRTASPPVAPALSRGARPLPPCGDVALGGNHRAPRLSAGRA